MQGFSLSSPDQTLCNVLREVEEEMQTQGFTCDYAGPFRLSAEKLGGGADPKEESGAGSIIFAWNPGTRLLSVSAPCGPRVQAHRWGEVCRLLSFVNAREMHMGHFGLCERDAKLYYRNQQLVFSSSSCRSLANEIARDCEEAIGQWLPAFNGTIWHAVPARDALAFALGICAGRA